ncbi:MAG TPA: DUF503 domain-containing protein [Candidatus Hydrothermia bacterium]|nr:DUF503 domain-containing protein [Candidatus Hydrothermae bacterium]MDD3649269.1 DUF503 domain-containing protein [Candidatus Hydrothermia bacterium]MDD5573204.1 DUF503 domain-containing protein [Candidatus Hydrothermia bacterium]HOP32480.1 DUF503 domain-containing protein [Candidatus Hydrothermia bacterium]HRD22726.1 DUF503 domain-containing protein [Candidatus Hydrothermia bacterium]
MLIGVLVLDLYLPMCNSLKEKRSVVKRLKDKIRNSFNVSVSELDDQDIWRRTQIGVSCISMNGKDANNILSKIVNLVESDGSVEVLDYKISFL